MFSSKDLFFTPTSTAAAYTVSKSLRFRSSASAYLSRTPGSAGNRTVWTWSCWVKRGKLGARQELLCADVNGTTDSSDIFFDSSDRLNVQNLVGNILKTQKITNAVFRDPSAWYHVVVSQNGSTACTVYVNNVSQTFSTSTGPDATNWYINNTTPQSIGNDSQLLANYFDGYMAEVNFIGGSALDPTSFGEYDTNGVWQPKAYTGSYSGTNSFYLKFTTVGATSGSNTGYGQDFSGNGNYWATNSFGTTSTGSSAPSYDSMLDSPTNATGDIGNYCTWNPLSGLTGTLSEANLYFYGPSGYASRMGTMALPTSGKIYFEATLTVAPYTPRASNTGYNWVGVALSTNFNVTSTPASNNVNGLMVGDNGYINNFAASASDMGTSFSVNNIIGFAIDTGANTYTIYKDNVSVATGTINVASGTSLSPMQVSYDASYGAPKLNFGQRPFIYTPPSGFSPLCTQNLPTPTITNGAQYMAAVTYSGTSASQTVTASSTNSGNNPNGTTFQPDLVWIKSRSAATNHELTDVVRGTTKSINTNNTTAEATDTNGLTAFTSSGFTVGSDSNYNNGTGPATYVAWEWNAGGSTVSGTGTGGITNVSYRANSTAGFSVVIYTGSGTNGTVTHGLGAVPNMIIVKNRSTGTDNWQVYHSSLTSAAYRMRFNTTDPQDSVPSMWNSTAPTSTVFYVGTQSGSNGSTNLMVAYCFAAVAGYSAFGSYVGNGSTDGPFIYTGFRSRWIMIKSLGDTSVPSYDSWKIIDTSRSPYNAANPPPLWANANYQEGLRGNGSSNSATLYENILSNGFKLGTASSYEVETNESGVTYIYAAFAENPFKISRAR